MARILDAPLPSPSPPPPPVTEEAWIDDALLLPYDNYPEVLNSMMFQDSNTGMGKETMTGTTTAGEEALLIDNANQPDYFQAWTNSFDSVALMEPGALQEPSYFDLEPSYLNFESCLLGTDQQMASSMQPDSADLLQPLNMSDTPYVQLPMMDTNLNNDIGATPLPSNLVELIPQPDVSLLQPLTMNDTLQPLTMNETTYDQLPMIDTNTSNDASSDFTCANFQSSSTSLLPGGNSCQDQQAHCVELPKKPCPDPEQRQRAVQRYKQKRNNRRFVKQIMYASRKATADTRRRVRGRFVKASLEQGSNSNDNKQPNHEPD
uniref:CCT domain-containing protein n=2 Tax=Oryza brachyantha TaxID=4533 RepID=J3L8V0_ORYBR